MPLRWYVLEGIVAIVFALAILVFVYFSPAAYVILLEKDRLNKFIIAEERTEDLLRHVYHPSNFADIVSKIESLSLNESVPNNYTIILLYIDLSEGIFVAKKVTP